MVREEVDSQSFELSSRRARYRRSTPQENRKSRQSQISMYPASKHSASHFFTRTSVFYSCYTHSIGYGSRTYIANHQQPVRYLDGDFGFRRRYRRYGFDHSAIHQQRGINAWTLTRSALHPSSPSRRTLFSKTPILTATRSTLLHWRRMSTTATDTPASAPADNTTSTTTPGVSDTNPWKEEWLAGPGGHQFYTRTYAPSTKPKAVVLFVHGFAEHIGRYEHVHVNYPKKGIVVFAYDQRGFGKTALDAKRSKDSAYGKTSWKDQLGDAEFWVHHLRAKKEWEGVPIFLMGHSMVRCFGVSHVVTSPLVGRRTRIGVPNKDDRTSQ